ncbi:MAG: flagellar protein FlgN [Synergistaceae bacterium]|nr:flagellar protein FlgN [Synergistaceae bacterium]
MQADFERDLSALASSELALYNELAVLVRQEHECVVSGDMESLLSILTDKQDVISRQERVQEGWNSLCGEIGLEEGREGPVFWEKIADLLDNSGTEELKSSLVAIRDTARRVLDEEMEVQKLLEVHVKDLRRQMLQLSRAKKAVRGYSANGGMI